MYQLIRQPGRISDRQFEIQFLDAGAEAFSFTFADSQPIGHFRSPTDFVAADFLQSESSRPACRLPLRCGRTS
jgi:hypothetical protein